MSSLHVSNSIVRDIWSYLDSCASRPYCTVSYDSIFEYLDNLYDISVFYHFFGHYKDQDYTFVDFMFAFNSVRITLLDDLRNLDLIELPF